jgi:hypothetical protein
MPTYRLSKTMQRPLTEQEESAISQYWTEHDTLTEDEVIEHFEKLFSTSITRTCVRRIALRSLLG